MLVWKEKLLTPQADALGYLHVRLRKDGKYKLFKVHVLVAMAFLGYDPSQYDRRDIDTSLVVHHEDGTKCNNCVENLTIMTQRDNLDLYIETRYGHKTRCR